MSKYSEIVSRVLARESKIKVFWALRDNLNFQRLLKMKKAQENLVAVKQKVEIVDGTLLVFNDFTEKFVAWIFKIFTTNSELAFKRKNNSFLIFRDKMLELKANHNYFALISSFFFRMKNLLIEDLPYMRLVV